MAGGRMGTVINGPFVLTHDSRQRTPRRFTMTATAESQTAVASPLDEQEMAQRLLESSAQLSRDPQTEVDWETPLDKSYYGMSPEWSTLYGTPYWEELTDEQRKELTRQEAACVADTGIWFEVILQQMMLRDIYTKDVTSPEFQW